MGNTAPATQSECNEPKKYDEQSNANVSKCPISGAASTPNNSKDSSIGFNVANLCPVKKVQVSSPIAESESTTNAAELSSSSGSACPIASRSIYVNPSQYNVYGQKLNPTNNMPLAADQKPIIHKQEGDLSKERVKSSIPKGGTLNDSWQYPSPQMFWNALVRKDKVDGAREQDMDIVVAVHNNMNENTWRQVLSWEEIHMPPAALESKQQAGREPKLLRFMGRPHDLSPKARLKLFFGHPAPFDRHDWVVDRGGQEVRYVIDYYHDESGVMQDQSPLHLYDAKSLKSIRVDVRPALDSIEAFADRLLWMPIRLLQGRTAYNPPHFFPPREMSRAEVTKKLELSGQWNRIMSECDKEKMRLELCKGEQECGAASISLQRCTAGIACPLIAKAFDQSIKATPYDEHTAMKVFAEMKDCLDLFKNDSAMYLNKKS